MTAEIHKLPRISAKTRERLLYVVFLVVMAPGMAGAGLLCWQILRWLEHGYWYSVSMIDAMILTGVGANWAQLPSSWLGVWRIMNWLPASVGGVVISVAALAFTVQLINEGSR
jgi:hypothetical protein